MTELVSYLPYAKKAWYVALYLAGLDTIPKRDRLPDDRVEFRFQYRAPTLVHVLCWRAINIEIKTTRTFGAALWHCPSKTKMSGSLEGVGKRGWQEWCNATCAEPVEEKNICSCDVFIVGVAMSSSAQEREARLHGLHRSVTAHCAEADVRFRELGKLSKIRMQATRV